MTAPHGARVLLVISVPEPEAVTRAAIAAGGQPRRDYLELQSVLGAEILFLDSAPLSRLGRLARIALGERIGRRVALAWEAFGRRGAYDVIFTDTDSVGLPLAMLLRLRGARCRRPRHVTLSHNLSSQRNALAALSKRALFRCGIAGGIDTMIVHSSAQRTLAEARFGFPGERIVRLPYQVDARFWQRPADRPPLQAAGLICIPGHECRDYPTLLAAVRELAVAARISTRVVTADQRAMAGSPSWPSNLSFGQYSYEELRELYADARVVVVPLLDVDFQAGITVVLEAMAMGKAVIVSAIRGQTDVVRDARGRRPGVDWPGFLAGEALGALPTGLYVAPGDPVELREAIQHLLDRPKLAAELGRNARLVAEEHFTVEAFARRFAAAILGPSVEPAGVGAPVAEELRDVA